MEDFHPVACPFCSLVCSDLHLSFDGGRLIGLTPSCPLGEDGFRRAADSRSINQSDVLTLKNSLQTARDWLKQARQPLIVLSGTLDNEAVQAALQLAKQYSAILACDHNCSASVLGMSKAASGWLSGTLHDLRGLSQVVLCGVEPDRTHPRLGEILGKNLATDSIFLDPPSPLEAIRWLRLAGLNAAENIPAKLADVAERIASAASGLVIFGPEWLSLGQPFTDELLLWIKSLGRQRPWYGLFLAPAPNTTGIVEMLLSETGYPDNLRFERGHIKFSPRLWRAEYIIQHRSSDLCFLVGQPASFSEKTLASLTHARTILIDPDQPAWDPSIWLPSARAGVEAPGLFQRLDGVPVELGSVLPGRRPLTRDLLLEFTHEGPLP